jgi:hypothetical protein
VDSRFLKRLAYAGKNNSEAGIRNNFNNSAPDHNPNNTLIALKMNNFRKSVAFGFRL